MSRVNDPHPPYEGPNEKQGLSITQIYTAVGLLVTIVAASMAKDIVPVPLILAVSVGYGIGSSISVALYRLASLLKNGTAETNVFGSGFLAGLAIAFGMTAIQSVPAILGTKHIVGLDFSSAVFAGLIGVIAGFLQSRSNFNELIHK